MNDWSWLDFGETPLQLGKSEQLFAQGAAVESMHYLVSGRVKLIRHPIDGEDVVLHVATTGEMIAEASFFSDRYHCSAITDKPSEILTINRDRALERMSANPQTSKQVMYLLARQIRDLRGLLELRNIRSAQTRILEYLATQADNNGRIRLNMSLRDMAYKLGLAHETLYRELRNLENQGRLERPAVGKFILHGQFH